MRIEWEAIFNDSVIRRLTQLAQRSYGVRVNFVDARGWLQGVDAGRFFNPVNKLLASLSASDEGFRAKRDAALKLATDVSHVRIPKRSSTEIGTSLVAVPLVLNGQYAGYVYADDFLELEKLEEQRVCLRNFYARKVADLDDLKSQINEVPTLNNSEISCLIDILEAIAEQLVGTQHEDPSGTKFQDKSGLIAIPNFKNNYIIGTSKLVRELIIMLSRIASSDATVLVTGESGVGKELVARTLYENSKRMKKNFVALNCGAFHENLLESELFGHTKGAFTGATKTRVGFFEQAHGGTLFLDEIGETTLSTQVKMLRFLQEGTFVPVGDSKEKKSNVRVIAATNRDLKQMQKRGEFRVDLFYRLRVIHIDVPSLRERKDDIPLLIAFFLNKHAEGSEIPTIAAETMEYLTGYHWPGNIRHLENEIRRLSVLAKGMEIVKPDFLSDDIVKAQKAKKQFGRIDENLKKAIEERERVTIIDGLSRTGGNKTRLARDLGMSRSLLSTKIKKYGIAS